MADKKSGGLVPLCNGTVITWTMPPLISGFLVMSALNKRQLMEENKAK